MLEVLHGFLVLLCGSPALESAEIASSAGFRIALSRVQSIFPTL